MTPIFNKGDRLRVKGNDEELICRGINASGFYPVTRADGDKLIYMREDMLEPIPQFNKGDRVEFVSDHLGCTAGDEGMIVTQNGDLVSVRMTKGGMFGTHARRLRHVPKKAPQKHQDIFKVHEAPKRLNKIRIMVNGNLGNKSFTNEAEAIRHAQDNAPMGETFQLVEVHHIGSYKVEKRVVEIDTCSF